MKIDRLIGILAALSQNEKTTAPLLAQRFEVSHQKGKVFAASATRRKFSHPPTSAMNARR